MGWTTSTRAKRLPPNWAHLRTQTKRRAQNKCEAPTHAPGCNGTGTECDHIIPGDNHHPTNLQWLSTQCHNAKTWAENAANNKRNAALRQRPPEPHPGKLP